MNQAFFDCSWISNYVEEAERLWIAGNYALRIVSIVVVQSAKNYERIMRALFLFDAMIFGVRLGNDCTVEVDATDCMLIQNLIDSELRNDACAVKEFDEYLEQEWNLFLQRKEAIVLDLQEINRHFQILSKIVVHDLVEFVDNQVPKENDNVLRKEWISIFPAVHTLTIVAASEYRFRLEALQGVMKSLPRSVRMVAVMDDGDWIKRALDQDSDVLTTLSNGKWHVQYEEPEDQLVFQLKSH